VGVEAEAEAGAEAPEGAGAEEQAEAAAEAPEGAEGEGQAEAPEGAEAEEQAEAGYHHRVRAAANCSARVAKCGAEQRQ
jgi:hypothetical protein